MGIHHSHPQLATWVLLHTLWIVPDTRSLPLAHQPDKQRNKLILEISFSRELLPQSDLILHWIETARIAIAYM